MQRSKMSISKFGKFEDKCLLSRQMQLKVFFLKPYGLNYPGALVKIESISYEYERIIIYGNCRETFI
jgi:hypothetical protein